MNLLDKINLYVDEDKNPDKGYKENIKRQMARTAHQIKQEPELERKNRLRIKYDALAKELRKRPKKVSEDLDESRINWNKTAYQYSHGKFPSSTRESGLWMFEINGEQVQYQGKWAEAKKYAENEAKLRLAKGIYGKSGRVDIKVMP